MRVGAGRRPHGVTAAGDPITSRLGVAEVEQRQVAELGAPLLQACQQLESLSPIEVGVGEDAPAADRPTRQDVEVRQLIRMNRGDRHRLGGEAAPGQAARPALPLSQPGDPDDRHRSDRQQIADAEIARRGDRGEGYEGGRCRREYPGAPRRRDAPGDRRTRGQNQPERQRDLDGQRHQVVVAPARRAQLAEEVAGRARALQDGLPEETDPVLG
jgi:hypothetical protein